jgi:hypothetical protein
MYSIVFKIPLSKQSKSAKDVLAGRLFPRKILTQRGFPPSNCRRFDPGGSLDRRVNCRCVSQPRWVGARWNTRGKGNRGSCYPAPRADALAVGGYKRSRERERACSSARPPARPPSRTRALDLPFIDVRRRSRCTMGGVAIC